MRQSLGLVALFFAIITAAVGAGALSGAAAVLWLDQSEQAQLAARPAAEAPAADFLSAPADVGSAGGDLLAAVRATRPAVVTIWNLAYVQESFMAPATLAPVQSGSGVIFDVRGYVATNAHVIEGAEAIEVVLLDGRRASADVVGRDPQLDVAVLRIDTDQVDLPAAAPLADSSLVEPGMPVLAIGSPLGTEYQNTVTSGIIAGLNRRVRERQRIPGTWWTREVDVVAVPLIQTDAAINQGNSGGPLINQHGEVIGLNTLVVRGSSFRSPVEGLGLAVPSNVVRALADEWIDGVPRPELTDLVYETVDPMLAREQGLARGAGALVSAVRRGSEAERLGLRAGDIIVAIDEVELDADHALPDILWRYRAGDRARIFFEHDGRMAELTLTIGGAPELAP